MRVIHTVPHVCKEASGPSYSVSRLCDQLGSTGHDINLLTLDQEARADATRYRHDVFASSRIAAKLGISPGFEASLTEKAGKADVLHNHGLWMMPNVYPGTAARASGKPLIVSPRGTFSPVALARSAHVKTAFWWLRQRQAVEQAKCLHATSEQEYRDIRSFGLKQPVAVIPNGVDIPELSHAPKTSERKTLLFLGRIHPIKGLDMLLQAWGEVAAEFDGWDLIIAGSDADGYQAELERVVAAKQLPRVAFAGPQYGEAKHAAYCRADLYVLPSTTENFGHTVAEALARETPVVTTTGTPWLPVIEQDCGWCVEPTATDLVNALKNAMRSPKSRLDEMGKIGRAWMKEDFSWESVADRMAQTYAWCMGDAPAPQWVRFD